MKKSNIKYIILFISTILVIDIGGGNFLKTQFQENSFGFYGKINNALKSKSEVFILGSSRAKHHYNSRVISKNMKYSCYNGGLEGYGLFYDYAILREKLKIKIPKVVIIDLSPNVITDDNSYEKLNMLLPYYNDYKSFQEIIKLDYKFSKLELTSNLYIYNSTLYDIFRSNIGIKTNSNAGFSPLNGVINEKNFEPFYLKNEQIDINKIVYLEKIINLCRSNEIRLIGVVSPTYIKYDLNNKIINKLKGIFQSYKLDFYDYSSFYKLYQNPEYFRDQLHMNQYGANIFSENFSNKIKDGI